MVTAMVREPDLLVVEPLAEVGHGVDSLVVVAVVEVNFHTHI